MGAADVSGRGGKAHQGTKNPQTSNDHDEPAEIEEHAGPDALLHPK
jgi:hypothetical protein